MVGELTCLFGGAVEAMDDPDLLGLVFFVKLENIGGSLDIMNDQRLLILFGKLDMFFKIFELKIVGIFMKTVKTCFPYGNDFVFL